jgi:tRNA pseudouridine55 synthase
MDFIAGEIIPVNKPYKWTSFGVVARVRWLLLQKYQQKIKVGHAGTLDPLATGVLLLCTGKATKRIEEIQAYTKEYVATLKLGYTTQSYDLEYPEERKSPTDHITQDMIRQTLQQFTGEIEQVPPAHSACKISGEHAYHRARRGEDVKLQAKKIHIERIELQDVSMPEVTIRVVCSKGTYIRALARDIGEALGCGAYLTALERTRIGEYTIDKCLSIDDVPAWLDTIKTND